MSRLDTASNGGVAIRAAAGMVAGGATAAAIYQPMVLLGAVGVALVLIVGVLFPAVWSKKKERRAAAAAVLHELLTAIRPTVPKPTDSPGA
jgi:NADH:ubiquinone oxidoreductase subunit 6 (subunit J)